MHKARNFLCILTGLIFGIGGLVGLLEHQTQEALLSAAVAVLWLILAELIAGRTDDTIVPLGNFDFDDRLLYRRCDGWYRTPPDGPPPQDEPSE